MDSIVSADEMIKRMLNWLERKGYLNVEANNKLAEEFVREEIMK